jgi:GNAT superfamily N-acetyltransferase
MPFEQAMKMQIDFEENTYGTEIIAVYDGKYIGSTDIEVYYNAEPNKGWTGGLGVLKEFRRKGIATALKIKAIESLLQKGVTDLRADNEENNPMYKINVALGFQPVPFSLEYMKEI